MVANALYALEVDTHERALILVALDAYLRGVEIVAHHDVLDVRNDAMADYERLKDLWVKLRDAKQTGQQTTHGRRSS